MEWQREVTRSWQDLTGTAEALTLSLGTNCSFLLLTLLSLSPTKNIPDVDSLIIYIKKAQFIKQWVANPLRVMRFNVGNQKKIPLVAIKGFWETYNMHFVLCMLRHAVPKCCML